MTQPTYVDSGITPFPVTGVVPGGTLIWRPGGTAGALVVVTPQAVAAAIAANPAITIAVDSSLAAAQVPSGVTMNCQMATTWTSYQWILSADAGDNLDIVTFLDGSVLSRPKQVTSGLTIYFDSKTLAGLVFLNNDSFTLDGASMLMTLTATTPGCIIAGTVIYYASNISEINQAGATHLFSVPVAQTLFLYALSATSAVDPSAATVAGTLNYLHDLSSPPVTMTTVTGTQTNVLLGPGPNYTGIQQAVAIHTQTQSSANPVALAAVAVQVKRSGLFSGHIHWTGASGTNGKTVEFKAVLVPFATASTRFTQAVGTNVQLGPGEVTALNWGGSLNVDAAGVSASGLLFNGVAPIDTVAGATVVQDRKVDTLTGELNYGDLSFDWSGLCGYGSTGTPIFAVGSFAVLVLELVSTAGGDVVTTTNCSIWLREEQGI